MGNTPVWVLPNIWRLGRVRNTKFGTDVPNKILLNAAKCPGYNFYCFCIIKGKSTGGVKLRPHPPPTQSRVNIFTWKDNRNRFITVLKTGRDNLTICVVYTEVWFPFDGKLSYFNFLLLIKCFCCKLSSIWMFLSERLLEAPAVFLKTNVETYYFSLSRAMHECF